MSVLRLHFVNIPPGEPLEKPQRKKVSLPGKLLQKRSRLAGEMPQGGVESTGISFVSLFPKPRHESAYQNRRSEVAKRHDASGSDKKGMPHLPGKIFPGNPKGLLQKIFPQELLSQSSVKQPRGKGLFRLAIHLIENFPQGFAGIFSPFHSFVSPESRFDTPHLRNLRKK